MTEVYPAEDCADRPAEDHPAENRPDHPAAEDNPGVDDPAVDSGEDYHESNENLFFHPKLFRHFYS